MRVIAQGRLTPNNYTDQQGVKHYGVQLVIDAIGPDLRYATAQVNRIQQSQGFQPQQPPQQDYGPHEPWDNNM